jgi:hypothetical protein
VLFKIKARLEQEIEPFLNELFSTSDQNVQQVIALMVAEYLQYNWSKIKKEVNVELYRNLLNLITQGFDEEVDPLRLALIRLACKIARLSWLNSEVFKVILI